MDILLNKKFEGQCRYRILWGMSIFDLISSTAYIVGSLATPVTSWNEETGIKAYGNNVTCQIQGIMHSLLCSSLSYNLFYALVLVLIVRYNKSEQWIKTKVEPVAHLLSIGGGVFVSLVNTSFGFDLIENHDWMCSAAFVFNNHLFIDILLYIPSVALLVTVILMMMLYMAVRNQERRVERLSVSRKTRQSRTIAHQCIAYTLAFYLTWFTYVVTMFCFPDGDYGKHEYVVYVIAYLFTPLQGFNNALVYFRPRISNFIGRAQSELMTSFRFGDRQIEIDSQDVAEIAIDSDSS